MTRPALAALITAVILTGCLLIYAGARPTTALAPARRRRTNSGAWARITGANLPEPQRRRHQLTLAVAIGGGLITAAVTGWILAGILVPAAVLGLPVVLRKASDGEEIRRLQALETWVRGLVGVITVHAGIEHAITETLASAPDALKPQIRSLEARLRSGSPTDNALRAFADDVNSVTGDLVTAALILNATQRGPGLADALSDLARSLAEEVKVLQAVKADRGKPRNTARWVTIMSVAILVPLLGFTSYASVYRHGLGQLIFLTLIGLYIASLVWMRRMSRPPASPRLLPATEGR